MITATELRLYLLNNFKINMVWANLLIKKYGTIINQFGSIEQLADYIAKLEKLETKSDGPSLNQEI